MIIIKTIDLLGRCLYYYTKMYRGWDKFLLPNILDNYEYAKL